MTIWSGSITILAVTAQGDSCFLQAPPGVPYHGRRTEEFLRSFALRHGYCPRFFSNQGAEQYALRHGKILTAL